MLLGAQGVADDSRNFGLDVFSQGTGINLTVPSGAPTGPIRVSTVGGTSAAFGIGLTGLVASADSGTPLNGALPSANPGPDHHAARQRAWTAAPTWCSR